MRFEPIRIYFSDLRSSAGGRQARMNYRVYSGCTQATQRAAGTAMASAMLDRCWCDVDIDTENMTRKKHTYV